VPVAGELEMLANRMTSKILLLALAGFSAQAASVHAQNGPDVLTDADGYKYLKPYIDPTLKGTELAQARARYNNGLSLVRKVLGGQGSLADNKREFDYFFLNMYFPLYTLTTDEALGDLPLERQKLFRDLESSSVPTVHKYACELILNQMKAIVQDNYHPVCRYNGMLIISSLNDVETVRIGANRTTPEPMVAALPFIYEQFAKADNKDAVKMAALLGILRHLEWDSFRGPVGAPTPAIGAPLRDEIVKGLLTLALQSETPEGREPLGHEWFRRRAIEGLTYASYLKVDPSVAEAFQTLLKNESEPIAIRCAAATAIGSVAYQAPAKVEIKPTTVELGYLALVACEKELTRVTAQRKEDENRLMRLSGGSSYGGSYGGGGSGGGYPGDTGGSSMPRMPRGGTGGPGGSGSGYRGGPRGGSAGMAEGSGDIYGYNAAPADPKQYRFDLIRRRLRAQLYAVEVGLGGPDPHVKARPGDSPPNPPRGMEALAKGKPEEEKFVTDVKELLKKLTDAVENADADVTELEKDIRKQMKPLADKTRKIVAPAPVDAPADLPELPVSTPAAKPGPAAAAPVPAAAASGKASPSDAPAGPLPAAPANGPAATPAPMPPAAPPE
jgi:hypothetical protein